MISLPTDEFVAKEIEFVGSLGLKPSHYPEMLNVIRTGKSTRRHSFPRPSTSTRCPTGSRR